MLLDETTLKVDEHRSLRGYGCLKRFYNKGDAIQCKAEVQMKPERCYHVYLYPKRMFFYLPLTKAYSESEYQSSPSFRDKLYLLLVKSVTTRVQNWYLVYTGEVALCATESLIAPFKTGPAQMAKKILFGWPSSVEFWEHFLLSQRKSWIYPNLHWSWKPMGNTSRGTGGVWRL